MSNPTLLSDLPPSVVALDQQGREGVVGVTVEIHHHPTPNAGLAAVRVSRVTGVGGRVAEEAHEPSNCQIVDAFEAQSQFWEAHPLCDGLREGEREGRGGEVRDGERRGRVGRGVRAGEEEAR